VQGRTLWRDWNGCPKNSPPVSFIRTHERVKTHTNTYEWVITHTNTRKLVVNISCTLTHVWFMTHSYVSILVTYTMNFMNESCHVYEWVMSHLSHTWVSHGTHMSESWHTHEWVMAHTWVSHGTHMNEGLAYLQIIGMLEGPNDTYWKGQYKYMLEGLI